MTLTSSTLEKPTAPKSTYVLLYDVSWEQLEQLDVTLAGTGARLTYLDGILEIMSPLSDDHEDAKSTLSLLLEAYFREKRMRFYKRGSATLGRKDNNGRREPDESYNVETKKSIPDLILEVTVTSGGIDKLEIYKRLGVPEVWYWEDGLVTVYSLQAGAYQKVIKSALLPDLNLELIARYSRMADQYDAVSEYSQIIAKSQSV
jgi:Uma2 family endonuclease